MQYQTFRGADVQEALLHVREALGADALIESTRHVRANQGALAGRTLVEIVAAPSAFPSRGPDAGQQSTATVARSSRLQERARARAAMQRRARDADHPELETTAVGREIVQLRLMLDELSQGRPAKDRTRALLTAAGFEGALARSLGTGASRAARAGSLELKH